MGTWAATGIAAASLVISCAAFVRAGRWRQQERLAAEPRLEVIARPWFTLGGQGGIVLERVEVIAHNSSISAIHVSEYGIEQTGAARDRRVFGRGEDLTVQPGASLYREIEPGAFTELSGRISKQSAELMFVIYVQTGHGTAARVWRSIPFSVMPGEPPRTPDGGMYSSWAA